MISRSRYLGNLTASFSISSPLSNIFKSERMFNRFIGNSCILLFTCRNICLYPPQKSSLLIYMYALTLKLSVATIGLLFWCGDGLWRLCSKYKNNSWIIVTNCLDSKVSIPINQFSFMHSFSTNVFWRSTVFSLD